MFTYLLEFLESLVLFVTTSTSMVQTLWVVNFYTGLYVFRYLIEMHSYVCLYFKINVCYDFLLVYATFGLPRTLVFMYQVRPYRLLSVSRTPQNCKFYQLKTGFYETTEKVKLCFTISPCNGPYINHCEPNISVSTASSVTVK